MPDQYLLIRINCDRDLTDPFCEASIERILKGMRGPEVIPEEILEAEVLSVSLDPPS